MSCYATVGNSITIGDGVYLQTILWEKVSRIYLVRGSSRWCDARPAGRVLLTNTVVNVC